ncbi:hypothetical protein BDV3_000375 [Batrachochytrium dendrobatidis]|uniref:UDENN domain-containing protein n=1 Tax=Batrachochytrium dendrobatidis (strain JEL423) TaxID=403673 RepID=A0A177WB82_BATDL|nr:hypothetical protein BDEG_21399 [Batrachochytrium dendrobatidis JEL423]
MASAANYQQKLVDEYMSDSDSNIADIDAIAHEIAEAAQVQSQSGLLQQPHQPLNHSDENVYVCKDKTVLNYTEPCTSSSVITTTDNNPYITPEHDRSGSQHQLQNPWYPFSLSLPALSPYTQEANGNTPHRRLRQTAKYHSLSSLAAFDHPSGKSTAHSLKNLNLQRRLQNWLPHVVFSGDPENSSGVRMNNPVDPSFAMAGFTTAAKSFTTSPRANPTTAKSTATTISLPSNSDTTDSRTVSFESSQHSMSNQPCMSMPVESLFSMESRRRSIQLIPSHDNLVKESAGTDNRYNVTMDAIFVAHFNTLKGNVIEYQFPAVANIAGVEYKSIPSGAHAIARDVIYFTCGLDRFGIAALENLALGTSDASNNNERGARIKAVGIVVSNNASLFTHLPFLQQQAARFVRNQGSLDDLIAYFIKHQQNPFPYRNMIESFSLENFKIGHPASHLPAMVSLFKVKIFVLWKYALLQKRILFYGQPPVQQSCHNVVCTTLLTSHSVPAGFKVKSNPLHFISVADIDAVSFFDSFIACTTETIFGTKPVLFDAFVEDTKINPVRVMGAKNTRPDEGRLATTNDADVLRYASLKKAISQGCSDHIFLDGLMSPSSGGSFDQQLPSGKKMLVIAKGKFKKWTHNVKSASGAGSNGHYRTMSMDNFLPLKSNSSHMESASIGVGHTTVDVTNSTVVSAARIIEFFDHLNTNIFHMLLLIERSTDPVVRPCRIQNLLMLHPVHDLQFVADLVRVYYINVSIEPLQGKNKRWSTLAPAPAPAQTHPSLSPPPIPTPVSQYHQHNYPSLSITHPHEFAFNGTSDESLGLISPTPSDASTDPPVPLTVLLPRTSSVRIASQTPSISSPSSSNPVSASPAQPKPSPSRPLTGNMPMIIMPRTSSLILTNGLHKEPVSPLHKVHMSIQRPASTPPNSSNLTPAESQLDSTQLKNTLPVSVSTLFQSGGDLSSSAGLSDALVDPVDLTNTKLPNTSGWGSTMLRSKGVKCECCAAILDM